MAKVQLGGPSAPAGGSKSQMVHINSVPQVPPELVTYLERVFAPTVSRGRELRDYDRMVGHQEVLDHLRAIVAQQDDQI